MSRDVEALCRVLWAAVNYARDRAVWRDQRLQVVELLSRKERAIATALGEHDPARLHEALAQLRAEILTDSIERDPDDDRLDS